VNETSTTSLAKVPGQKNILLHRETLIIIAIIIGAIAILSILFSFLWAYFKTVFICLIAFILIVVTRKTDSWKMGIECYYIFTFLLAYAFSPWLAIFVTASAILFVVKFFRPDELHGALTQITAVIGLAFTASHFAAKYGAAITQPQLLFIAILTFVIWDIVRFLVALKISPAHWVKLFASLLTGAFVNYFYYITFAYPLLQFLLRIN